MNNIWFGNFYSAVYDQRISLLSFLSSPSLSSLIFLIKSLLRIRLEQMIGLEISEEFNYQEDFKTNGKVVLIYNNYKINSNEYLNRIVRIPVIIETGKYIGDVISMEVYSDDLKFSVKALVNRKFNRITGSCKYKNLFDEILFGLTRVLKEDIKDFSFEGPLIEERKYNSCNIL